MTVRCWGARGSIPVSGEEYLKYGGSTTCMEIRTSDDQVIIIDAGSGVRKLGNALLKEGRDSFTFVFTHAHLDHVLGFPFFRPIYMKGTHITLFGCPFAQQSIESMLSRTMSPPSFPVNFEDVEADVSYGGECLDTFTIGAVTVTPILLSHPNQGQGYRFAEADKSFVFLTDNELTFKHPGGLDYRDYLDFSSGADLLIHDAEFTEEEYRATRTWGHSVYKDALRLAVEAKVKHFGLFHHSQDRTDTAVDELVGDCRRIIGEKGSAVACFAASEGMEIQL